MVDIRIFCITSAVKDQLLSKIKSSIKSVPFFDSNYLDAVDTAGTRNKLSEFFFHCYVLGNPYRTRRNISNSRKSVSCNISNTRESVSSDIQRLRSRLKKRGEAEFF